MTLKETVEQDGVGMRWMRTAATTVTSLAAAVAVVWGGVAWLAAPRFAEYAESLIDSATVEVREDVAKTANQIDRVEKIVDQLGKTVDVLTQTLVVNSAPSWRFSIPDTTISDGAIGGKVTITAAGFKLRECGIPRVDLYFINGGGVYHRFEGSSLLTSGNRGVAFPVAPDRIQIVKYTATIPVDDNVTPGRALGYISVTYPDGCPNIEEVVAGPLQFRITGP